MKFNNEEKCNDYLIGDDNLDKKYIFDQMVINYEKRRPNYGTEVFKDIIDYAGITMDKSIIEIGCGTGKATEPFLKTKCEVTAIELGENLALYTKKKFRDYGNLDVVKSAFEDYECGDNKFDMLYSATAFHWIPEEIGYKKAFRIIKNGGSIALFWNKPFVNNKDNPLHQKIQSIYNDFLPEWNHKVSDNERKSKHIERIDNIKKYGFVDMVVKQYENVRTMSGAEYIELLNTYSDHASLDKSIQLPFYNAIRTAIEDYGDEMIIYDIVNLYLARKPR